MFVHHSLHNGVFSPIRILPRKTAANNQFKTVGFHWMKEGLPKKMVMLPSTVMSTSEKICIRSILRGAKPVVADPE